MSDFNGDTIPDLVVANTTSNSFTVWLGNGDGTLRAPNPATYHGINMPYSVVAEDFDGDGIVDLAIVEGGSNSVFVHRGNGDGTFDETPVVFSAGFEPHFIVAGDFNGDGQIDLAVANSYSDTVSILFNTTRLFDSSH